MNSIELEAAPETLGNPLGPFPTLQKEGYPYNLWLSGRILEPTLDRWSRGDPDHRKMEESVLDGIDGAAGRSRLALQEMAPLAEKSGEAAVLAAMGVTANLIRSLAIVGEFVLADAHHGSPRVFRISRLWCGLIEYPGDAPYFLARIQPPDDSARPRARRQDPGYLRRAFWCTAGEVDAQCAEAIGALSEAIRRNGLTPDDLRRFQVNSSGVVRPRNSSM